MVPFALVTTDVDGGRRLLDGLAAEGVEVRAAFWAKMPGERRWRLHIGTPGVNEDTPVDPYEALVDVIRRMPDLCLDQDDVRLIGSDDTMTRDAILATRSRAARARSRTPA